jgi:hypothetical protein
MDDYNASYAAEYGGVPPIPPYTGYQLWYIQ